MLLYLTRDKFKVTMVCDVWTPRLVLPVLSRCINIFAYHSTVCRNLLHCGVSLHRSFIRLWTSISTVVRTTTPPPATSWRRYHFIICTGHSFAHTRRSAIVKNKTFLAIRLDLYRNLLARRKMLRVALRARKRLFSQLPLALFRFVSFEIVLWPGLLSRSTGAVQLKIYDRSRSSGHLRSSSGSRSLRY